MTTKSPMVRGGHGKPTLLNPAKWQYTMKAFKLAKNGKTNIEYVKKKEEKEEIVENPNETKRKQIR